ncbi:MAG: TlpA family protein disulfide reductase [Acidobacteria bacterium]|nr:TlpA family protein disulfide reductase [Acidobacteriota bacterium]
MMRRYIFIVALLLLMSAAGSSRAVAQQPQAGSAATPQKEAGFRLKGVDGKTYDTSEMRGDVLVVSFGATWCTPCLWEIVALEELKEEYRGKPVRFFWVSIDDERRTSKYLLRQFAKDRGMTIPVLRDPKMEAFLQFSDTARIPVMVFFDREGHFAAPTRRGMSSEISEYKRLVRERVGALLKMEPGKTIGTTTSK